MSVECSNCDEPLEEWHPYSERKYYDIGGRLKQIVLSHIVCPKEDEEVIVVLFDPEPEKADKECERCHSLTDYLYTSTWSIHCHCAQVCHKCFMAEDDA